MLKIRYTNRFKKDYKLIVKRGYDTKLLEEYNAPTCQDNFLAFLS